MLKKKKFQKKGKGANRGGEKGEKPIIPGSKKGKSQKKGGIQKRKKNESS